MLDKDIYIGNSKLKSTEKEINGEIVQFENESYYKISNYDAMPPFFMSIVSHSNHWMFISSNGALTAGRQNSESSLFPYYTDDKITETAHITGSKTILQVQSGDKIYLWEPFSNDYTGLYKIYRNLYKNNYGNKVVFEEINEDLGLTYRYQWNSSDAYGFVKKSTLINNTNNASEVTLLDGIQNIMPYGVNSALQNASSNLVDAYKKSELEADIGLGIYALSAIIVDRAEPSEALKATTVWSTGLQNCNYLVSSSQLDAFRNGKNLKQEINVKAKKGAYFLNADLALKPSTSKSWMTVAEVNQSIGDIAVISEKIKKEKNLFNLIEQDIELGSKQLVQLNAASDALQFTADKLRNTRHFSNTLFNIMRGGTFDDNYKIEHLDFVKYLQGANKNLYKQKEAVINKLASEFTLKDLRELAENDSDADFKRLAYEYMPLKFSRRHGDPSRPWNKFSINTVAEDGSKILDYEGNWRDIFQNWEALAHSYPAFVDSMIHKFLNASTFDGYNPYRVTKDGFDWEAIEPDDPWSYIGYWGDHQIIYLLKFLEFIENYYPGKLGSYFNERIFVYANVPYKIKDYKATLKNPKDTIVFDEELDLKIREERSVLGADGALLKSIDNSIYRVNLLEKLLATVLAKVSNFIPEGGIWMNTQRPEWNDANNALVGNGVSMVTLNYLRRFLTFFEKVVEELSEEKFKISKELITFFNEVRTNLSQNSSILSSTISNTERKLVMDGLGTAGSNYRDKIYNTGFSNQLKSLTKDDVLQFVQITLKYLEQSIDANKRSDNLYHSYNLMTVENDTEVSVSYLSEMLEGQVAALSSGYISSEDSLALLDGLKSSALFRDDQYSYLLYPNKELSRFVDKNTIPAKKIEQSALVQQLLKEDNIDIITKDINGAYHFNGSFNNADSLKRALSNLSPDKYGKLVKEDEPFLLSVFEEIFDHKSFTGRSGTFFGYEGLGSIYWHMVSKLLLAVQETCLRAINEGVSEETIGRLLEHYYEINEGIGVHKSPELYGAFPTDPYSHTPTGKGAQQPGMTGQVKEDILSRFGELGVSVEQGKVKFEPHLLRKDEFLKKNSEFKFLSVNGQLEQLLLKEGSLGFTYCQVPILYNLGEVMNITVYMNDKSRTVFEGSMLDSSTSASLFERKGEIQRIEVTIIK
ncbi:hypothetical protein [uncultured Croceitalea sp.]|uniref:hypothetical protein n=1 Tax=uncultured Croceitalea sp. TaxID=1798908 RepID=UPI0033062DDF